MKKHRKQPPIDKPIDQLQRLLEQIPFDPPFTIKGVTTTQLRDAHDNLRKKP